MPFPLMPILLRLGAAAAAGYAASRLIAAHSHPGRLDLRAEDALDDLDEGLAFHQPRDLASDDAGNNRQGNAALRLRRVVRYQGQDWELDAALVARVRLRRLNRGQTA